MPRQEAHLADLPRLPHIELRMVQESDASP